MICYALKANSNLAILQLLAQAGCGFDTVSQGEMERALKAGADPHQLYEVIINAAGNSWMFENRVPHILAGDYTPLSTVNIFVKDLGIVLDAARALKFR